MSYLDRITACNSFELQRYIAWEIDGLRVGLVRREFAALLAAHDVFSVDAARVRLNERLTNFESRSAAVAPVLRELAEQGHIPGWRNEALAVTESFAAK